MRHFLYQIYSLFLSHFNYTFSCTLLFTHFTSAEAQQHIKGFFDKDSIKIGEYVHYTLSFRHSPDMEFVFPDSSFNFSPFQYVDKAFFPTHTDSLGSLDSVVYRLTTFEIDKLQQLTIPVLIRDQQKKDPNKLYPIPDSIMLIELVDSASLNPENIRFSTSWAAVDLRFNYPYLIIFLLFLFLLSLAVILLFGKNIRRAYRMRKLRKSNTQFILYFDQLIYGGVGTDVVEEALLKWKKHTGSLINLPLVACTTREIGRILPNTDLNTALQVIDRSIYANITPETEDMRQQLVVLKEYALKAFRQKIKELQNG